MTDVQVRAARTGDGADCARVWTEAGQYFEQLNPDLSQVPKTAGLASWFEAMVKATGNRDDKLTVVAESSDGVVGLLFATLHEPASDTSRQLERDLGRRRVHVDALVVDEQHRRGGVGRALVAAAQEWGRQQAARIITVETEANNEASIAFHRDELGFETRLVTLRKEL
jgi:ribosomal protein S18 acetylase RimI-like enzyme